MQLKHDALYDRSVKRWYKLIDHPIQLALINDNVRFKVVPAGRRSGKSERAKRYIVHMALTVPGTYFVAAPTRQQVKRIYWEDLKLLSFCSLWGKALKPLETELVIKFPNGSTITLIGLDTPERIEGSFWTGGIIDEIADTKPNAWAENISPALDTVHPDNPNYRAWCWLIGVPDGLNHYYELYQKGLLGDDPNWKSYTWKSSEILPEDVILAAKSRMSSRQYRQEYEASFESATGRIYEDYGQANITSETIQTHELLHWHHDFNFSPMSSGVAVVRDGSLFILDEIILQSAIARQTAMEFCDKFKDHQNKTVYLFGDPAGRAGEKHGHASDYIEIEQVLRASGWSVHRKVSNAAPAIRDRQNSVRAMIANASGEVKLFVNPNKCPYVNRGLATVQTKKGSTFLEEDSEHQHITTAIGYMVHVLWPSNGGFASVQLSGI